jgi:hypothetical protein
VPEGEKLETILVVEDDADLRTYVSEALRHLNYRVISAPSAHAALTTLLQEGNPGRPPANRCCHAWYQWSRARQKSSPVPARTQNPVYDRVLAQRRCPPRRLDDGVELVEKPISLPKLALRVREMLDRQVAQ